MIVSIVEFIGPHQSPVSSRWQDTPRPPSDSGVIALGDTDVAGVVVGAGGEGQEEGGRAEAETSNGRNKVAHSNGCKMECAGGTSLLETRGRFDPTLNVLAPGSRGRERGRRVLADPPTHRIFSQRAQVRLITAHNLPYRGSLGLAYLVAK